MLNHYFVALLTTSITHATLSCFVCLRGHNRLINRTYALYSAAIAVWSGGEVLAITSDSISKALFFWRFNHVGVIFIPIFFVHFVMSLYSETEYAKRRWIIFLSYFAGIVLLGLNLTGILIRDVEQKFEFNYFINSTGIYPYFFSLWVAWAIYGLTCLFRLYFTSPPNKRNQLGYFSISMCIAYIGGVPNFLPTFNIEIPGLMPFGTYAVSLYAFFTVYAIVAYRLMDIDVIIRRTVVFAGLFAMAMLSVAALGAVTQNLLGQYLKIHSMISTALGIIIAILFYDPTRKLLIHLTDRFLFQKKYDYKGLLKDASRGIALIQSLDHLASLIVTFISLRARIKNVATLVSSSDGKMLELKALRGYDKQTMKEQNISFDHPLVRMIQASHQPIRISELKDMKDVSANDLETIQSEMKKWKAEVIIPSFLGRNTANLHLGDGASLRSLLVLGCKKSDEEYSDEDLAIFFALAQEAAIAIENARLYDEAVKRAKELQHMNNELDAASSKLMRSLDEVQASKKELEENKAMLVEMKRRENLERLAASIGHELNNPLAVFNMQCSKFARDITKIETALDQMQSGEPENSADSLRLVIQDEKFLLGRFEHFYERIRAVADTVDGLLKAGDRVTGVSLRMILDYSFEEVRFVTYSENLSETRVELDLPSQMPPIRGNAFQLQAVFVNLILNAFHALRETPDRKISISAELDSDQKIIQIIFKDNGCGMTRDVLEKCFEYRFTTKGEKGTGIGLTVCKQTIERHGGTLSVESAPGKGTAFTIHLPVWDEKREPQNYFNPTGKQEFGDLEKAA